ncbi:hypothetical protein [Arthrobacter sp. efr-133-TYG-120]|uniref:hypothetical protein n=1 Tax=Arthrobacter sp. efr-133-TYG-120 TaxID=3040280 RepID=UPI00254A73B6|nr:hypothetical protein [Arthrobacter sp. efr-133-TYG-120]
MASPTPAPSPSASTDSVAPQVPGTGVPAQVPVTPSPSSTTLPAPGPTGPAPTPAPTATPVPTPGATPPKAIEPSPTTSATPAPSSTTVKASGFAVLGAIGAKHESLGGDAGGLGPAIAEQQCDLPGGACRQQFQRGWIYFVPGYGTFAVWGAINGRYQQLSADTGGLGYPSSDEQCGLPGGACRQQFQRGSIYFVPGYGTFAVWGAINGRYQQLSADTGGLGYPSSDEQCGLPGGVCSQQFQRGSIYFVPGYGTFSVVGAISGRYQSLGGLSGYLGAPHGDEQCGLRFGGCSQQFTRGKIYFAIGAGTQPVWGGLGSFYDSRHSQDGVIGYPVTGEACDGAGNCSQSFQFGQLQWINGGGVRYTISTAGYCPALNSGAVKYPTNGAQRVSLAVADAYRATQVSMITCVRRPGDGQYVKEWGAIGSAGESGFAGPGVATGPTWQAFSPTGSFTVTEAFGLGNPGTALSYRTLNQFSRWGGRLNANYNQYFESSSDIFPDENMWYFATRPTHDYRQGVVINYNRPPDSPIIMNAGFAIFMHGNNKPTWGCLAFNDPDLLQFMHTAQAGDRIVMGVGYEIFW